MRRRFGGLIFEGAYFQNVSRGKLQNSQFFSFPFFSFIFCHFLFLSSFFFFQNWFFEFSVFTLAPELSFRLRAVLQTVRKFFSYLYLIIIILVSFAADQSGKRTLFDPG